MPARLLRRIPFANTAAASTWGAAILTVPPARALVGKFLILPTDSAVPSIRVSVAQGVDVNTSHLIAWQVPIALGESYTETGVVIPAGISLFLRVESAANTAHFTFFGEEVDN